MYLFQQNKEKYRKVGCKSPHFDTKRSDSQKELDLFHILNPQNNIILIRFYYA